MLLRPSVLSFMRTNKKLLCLHCGSLVLTWTCKFHRQEIVIKFGFIDPDVLISELVSSFFARNRKRKEFVTYVCICGEQWPYSLVTRRWCWVEMVGTILLARWQLRRQLLDDWLRGICWEHLTLDAVQ